MKRSLCLFACATFLLGCSPSDSGTPVASNSSSVSGGEGKAGDNSGVGTSSGGMSPGGTETTGASSGSAGATGTTEPDNSATGSNSAAGSAASAPDGGATGGESTSGGNSQAAAPPPGSNLPPGSTPTAPADSTKTTEELVRQGATLAQNGDIFAAVVPLREAVAKSPEDIQANFALGQVLQQAGMVTIQQKNDPKNGYPMFLESARAFRTAYRLAPQKEQIQRVVSSAYYNEACAYAVSDRPEEAMASLKESFELGFNDMALLDTDPDLEILRGRDDFKLLVDGAKNKGAGFAFDFDLPSAILTEEQITAASEYAKQKADYEALLAEANASKEVDSMLATDPGFLLNFSLPSAILDDAQLAEARAKLEKEETGDNPAAATLVSREASLGKVLIVDVWGTWCPPCRKEIPHFVDLYNKYHDRGLDIVGINYEGGEALADAVKITDFAKEYKIPYPCVLGDEATQNQIPDFGGYPTTLFIDATGKVRAKMVGFDEAHVAVIEGIVKALLVERELNAAALAMKTPDEAAAKEALKYAASLGITDATKITGVADFAPLAESQEYKDALATIEMNVANSAKEPTPPAAPTLAPPAKIKLADLKGKAVIVDIWGTWCPPCRQEIPHFVELYKKYQSQGLEIVGINYEGDEPAFDSQLKITNFAKEFAINYPCVLGDEATQSLVPDFQGYPTTLFIDRSGKVKTVLVGAQSLEVLEANVKSILESSSEETAPPAGATDPAAGGEASASPAESGASGN